MKLVPNEDKFMEVVRGTGGASLAWQVLLRFDGFQQHQGHSAFLVGSGFDIKMLNNEESNWGRHMHPPLQPHLPPPALLGVTPRPWGKGWRNGLQHMHILQIT